MSAIQKIEPSNIEIVDEATAQRKLIRETYGRGLNDSEFELLIADAEHRGLDVITKDVAAIKFGQGPAVIMPTVNGLRKLADRSGLLTGTEGPFFCGSDGKWMDLWLDEKNPPKAAKFVVHRKDRDIPITAVVTWAERAQRMSSGGLMPTWKVMPAHMLGKVAESDAYKKARLVPDNRVDYDDPQARQKAYGRLHAVAEAQGLTHEQSRQVVRALVPGIESLTDDDVDVEDIHDAASLIEAIGEEAIPDDDEIFVSGLIADAESGEIIDDEPSDREQWRIAYREVIQSQDRNAYSAFINAAGDVPWKWQDLIERASSLAAAKRLHDLARKAGIRDEDAEQWLQTYTDGQSISAERAKGKLAEAQASTLPGMPADYSNLGQ